MNLFAFSQHFIYMFSSMNGRKEKSHNPEIYICCKLKRWNYSKFAEHNNVPSHMWCGEKKTFIISRLVFTYFNYKFSTYQDVTYFSINFNCCSRFSRVEFHWQQLTGTFFMYFPASTAAASLVLIRHGWRIFRLHSFKSSTMSRHEISLYTYIFFITRNTSSRVL